MPSALILLADGTEEIEFVTPYDVLTRAGFDVKSVGVELKNGEHAVCSRNVRIIPDIRNLSALPASATADVLILPGGGPGAATFCSTPTALDLVRGYRSGGKWVAAICAGTTAVVKAGGEKVRVTSHPSVRGEVEKAGWKYGEERIVVEEKVVTSRGPGTAMLFALTIVELLCGKDKRDEVAGPMILADAL